MRALVILVIGILVVGAGTAGLTVERQGSAGGDMQQPAAPASMEDGGDGVDDAAHFKYYQNDSDISQWYEWWYLNVKGDNGHNLLIEFFTFGDLNNPLTSAVGVVMLFMDEDGSTYKSLKSYPGIPYSLSYETCDVSIAGDRFVRQDDGSYDVTYNNYLQQVDVDLHVTRLTAPVAGRRDMLNDREWMAWNAAVPAGMVQGTVSFRDDGRLRHFNMSGVGYHDHNWGIARKLPLQWDWGEFTDPAVPVTFMYGAAKIGDGPYEHGGVNIATASGERFIPIENISLAYREWETIAGISKPTELHITGSNGSCSVNATVRLHRYYLVAGTGWFGMPYLAGSLTADIHMDGRHIEMRSVVGFYEHHYFSPFS